MILLKRNSKVPVVMSSQIFKRLKSELTNFYKKPQKLRRQEEPPYIHLPNSILARIRTQLLKDFKSKCVYCESPITATYHGDFDHFRPQSSAKGMPDEFSLDHYWTLAFDWRNMYMCCEVCDRYKVNWFPVEGKRASLSSSYLEIVNTEKALLLDPCFDDPAQHIAYKENGFMVHLTSKGKCTIDTLKLNRKELVTQRSNKLRELSNIKKLVFSNRASSTENISQINNRLLDKLLELIGDINQSVPQNAFLGIQKYFIAMWLKKNSGFMDFLWGYGNRKILKKYFSTIDGIHSSKSSFTNVIKYKKVSIKPRKQKVIPSLRRFSIESIEIENFKSIEYLKVKFPESRDRREPWLMLLGENGVGKSSFLQAVSLALMGERYREKINVLPGEILRSPAKSGFVRIYQTDAEPIELTFNKTKISSNISLSPCFLLGYGSTRLFSTKTIRPEKTKGRVRTKNLFNPETGLFADDWLVTLFYSDKRKFDFASRALKVLLSKELDDPLLKFSVRNNNIWIKFSDQRVPNKLKSLSDGYRSMIALACDMMEALMKANSTMEFVEGIVLLDEIGTHLHPRWKMRIVDSLRDAFPKLQFITTTHDPLCLKGLNEGEVAIFERNKAKQIFVTTDLPDPGEFTAEQLLASKFFGLSSTIDADIESDFNEYYELLSNQETLTVVKKRKLSKLKEKLRGKSHLGNSLREELAFTAADKILSEEKKLDESTPLVKLKSKTISMLQELWNKPIVEQEKIIKA